MKSAIERLASWLGREIEGHEVLNIYVPPVFFCSQEKNGMCRRHEDEVGPIRSTYHG